MMTAVLSKDGRPLMPTYNIRKVRRMLKNGKAKIIGHNPFTIQLQYESETNTQPVELTEDTGYLNIGLSVKSEKHEFVSREYKLLPDEKNKHQAQKRIRTARRNRKRYRRPMSKREKCSRRKQKNWLAPSLRNKADRHVDLVKRFMKLFPVTSVVLEMGQFDTAVLSAVNQGLPVPEGLAYQHGPKYGFDTLREATFARDRYRCVCCHRSAIKDKITLVIHHRGYRKGDRSNRLSNLASVCTDHHTPAEHKKGGKLWDLPKDGGSLAPASFMNAVKWYIYGCVSELGIKTAITYGAVTKRERLDRNIVKSHSNDAYCIGEFHPKHRAHTEHYRKRRRNDRCLQRFYDAVYVDMRTGKTVKASELGCNRTKRKVSRSNERNLRPYRGKKVKAGYNSIRKGRHSLQAGDIVQYKGRRCEVKTVRFKENKKLGRYETVEFKPVSSQVYLKDVRVLRRSGGWVQVQGG